MDSQDENTAPERAALREIKESVRLETEYHTQADNNRIKRQIMVHNSHVAYRKMVAHSVGLEYDEEELEFGGLSLNDNSTKTKSKVSAVASFHFPLSNTNLFYPCTNLTLSPAWKIDRNCCCWSWPW